MVFKNPWVLGLWMKVASALEGLRVSLEIVIWIHDTFDNNLKIFEGELLVMF